MLERIIVACGGVASIYLGYRLFVVANLTSVSGGTFKSKIFLDDADQGWARSFLRAFRCLRIGVENLSSQISCSTSLRPNFPIQLPTNG